MVKVNVFSQNKRGIIYLFCYKTNKVNVSYSSLTEFTNFGIGHQHFIIVDKLEDRSFASESIKLAASSSDLQERSQHSNEIVQVHFETRT